MMLISSSSLTSFLYVAKRLVNHIKELALYQRAINVTSGNALAARLAKSTLDLGIPILTSTPAKLVGVEARTGTIEEGKDADLALWNGEPFQPTSRVVAVIVDGVLVWDGRE